MGIEYIVLIYCLVCMSTVEILGLVGGAANKMSLWSGGGFICIVGYGYYNNK
jgi:hypothetical protein